MKIFLTGGTGLLGNNVARLLSDRGDEVVALVRCEPSPAVFESLAVRTVRGDLSDAAAIDAAVADCDAVVHSAALIHLGWTCMEQSMRANRDGTATVADAAKRHGKRMVHIGTVNTIAVGAKRTPSDEETPLTARNAQVPCAYVESKRASVAEIEKRLLSGLDAVLVHPGFMLGPHDWKPSSGRMFLELAKRRPLVWPTGGCSVCDVRDVAGGVVSALDRGLKGRHYVMAGHNVTYRTLWSEIARRVGKRAPVLPVGPAIRLLAGVVGDTRTKLTGQETDINSAAIRMSSQFHWYRSDRAHRELGYDTRPLSQTLDDAADWIQSQFLRSH